MKRLFIIVLLLAPIYLSACSKPVNTPSSDTPGNAEPPVDVTDGNTRIKLTVGGNVITATLENNTVAKAFAALLPLTVDMSDYAQAEKIFYPPGGLSTEGTPAGTAPSAGDIAYYAPWGNVAVFYKDAGFSSSLFPVGRIDGNMDVFRVSGDLENVRIESVE